MGSGQNLNSLKFLCMSSLPARMKMIQLKIKGLGWSQIFSHYKYMEIFPDPQRQLTPQSLVGFSCISDSFEILWLSLLPAIMKKMGDGAICCDGNQSSDPI